MELAEHSLHDLLHKKTKFPDFSWDTRLDWLEDSASGLQYLHQQKPPIFHRDLKPPNILIRGDWRACLTDFGLAEFDQTLVMTKTKGVGTPVYQAPEVLTGKYTTQADIWSLGVVMFEVMTRQLPYSGMSEVEVMSCLKKGDPTHNSDNRRVSVDEVSLS